MPEDAVPALVEALHDPEGLVRSNAAYDLARLDPMPAGVVPLLAERAAHPDAGFRLNAALTLQAVPVRAAADALHSLLGDPSPRLRLLAARRVLAEDAADAGAAAAVADTLTGPAAGLREAAAELAAAISPAAGAVRAAVVARLDDETDAGARGFLAAALARLNPGADGDANAGGPAEV